VGSANVVGISVMAASATCDRDMGDQGDGSGLRVSLSPPRAWFRPGRRPWRDEGPDPDQVVILLAERTQLLALRAIGDPDADKVVRAILAKTQSNDPHNTLGGLIAALRDLTDSGPVTRWVEHVERFPVWADVDLVERGQEVFTAWSLDIVTTLFCASLPFAYAAAKGTEVLKRQSELAHPATAARRIAETGQMLLDISQLDALRPGRRGYKSIRTVRLLHATIRARLTQPSTPGRAPGYSPHWDVARLGVPINQEDLLGTLLSFSTVVFGALDRLGISLDERAKESYLHMWAVVGHLLGIQHAESILDPTRAEQLTSCIAEELHAPSAAGVRLMDVLMGEMELSMPWGFRKLPRTLVRHMAGDDIADMLGVSPGAWWRPLLPAMATVNRAAARAPWGSSVLQAPSRLLGRSMIRMWIDRTILDEQPTHVWVDAQTVARLKLGASPDRTDVGWRGRMRGRRRAMRARMLTRRQPQTPPLASPVQSQTGV
jgi:ER-bound oxygenase mpaB/B'/Rubber oxygenase, catalytic domain